MNNGTPQSLNTAIYNGLKQSIGASEQEAIMMAEAIEPHVRDFLAQRFGATLLAEDSVHTEIAIRALWKSVTGRDIK